MTKEKGKEILNTPGGLFLFSLPFSAVGIGMLCLTAYTFFTFLDMQSWEKTQAMLTKVKQIVNRDSESTTYGVDAEYEYSFNGKKYIGSRVTRQDASDSSDYFRKKFYFLENRLKRNLPVDCFVNPKLPEESVLFVELRWYWMAFYMIFMFVFGGGGTLLTALALKKKKEKTTAMSGTISSGRRRKTVGLTIAAVCVLVLSSPMFFILPGEVLGKGNYLALLGGIFPLIGLIIAFFAIKNILFLMKYGESVFRMKSVPGVIGGKLEGVIEISSNISPEDGFDLTLSCIHRTVTSGSEHSSIDEKVVWREKKKILSADYESSSIPVLFGIPYHGTAETRGNECSNDSVYWKLEVSASLPGLDFNQKFQVPVKKTKDSSPDFKLVETKQGGVKETFSEYLESQGIRIEQLSKTEKAFIFSAFRDPADSITALVIGTVLALVATIIFITKGTSLIWPISVAAVSSIFFMIFIYVTFFRSRVTFTSRTIILESGIFFTGRREFEIADMDTVEAEETAQSGSKSYYALFLYFKSDKRAKLAAGITDRKLANRLSNMMNELIVAGNKKS